MPSVRGGVCGAIYLLDGGSVYYESGYRFLCIDPAGHNASANEWSEGGHTWRREDVITGSVAVGTTAPRRRNRPSSVKVALKEEGAKPAPECACVPCSLKRRYRSYDLRGGTVHQYHYVPRWRLQAQPEEHPGYYLGVELETDNDDRVYTDEQAVSLRLPKQLWLAKHDSSVSGPEFVSQPASLAYWHGRRKQVAKMLEDLRHAGFRSHDNDTCGMHVNISASAFGDPSSGHLFRFLTLLHSSPAWSMRMSQRTQRSAAHWAKFTLRTAKDRAEFCDRVRLRGDAGYDRYLALNVPSVETDWRTGGWKGRYEFRLPRGTLRVERFYKNLEWTAAMIEFTRETTKPKECVPAKFMPWALERAEQYPDLAEFIVARFGQ